MKICDKFVESRCESVIYIEMFIKVEIKITFGNSNVVTARRMHANSM